MNRLQNTIKENCAGEESCTANILCKANTLFVTPTPSCKDWQQWTVLLYLWHITMDSTSRVTSPDTQGLPTNPLGMGSWVNERPRQRHSYASNSSIIRNHHYKNAALGSIPRKSFGKLLMALHTHPQWSWPTDSFTKSSIFFLDSEESKNTLLKPYPWRVFVYFSLCLRKKNILKLKLYKIHIWFF